MTPTPRFVHFSARPSQLGSPTTTGRHNCKSCGHALTMISNGGFLPFNFNTNESTANPQDPYNFRKYNYGNADYDVRHNASLNYVWNTPKMSGLKGALASWTLSGTLFWRSGLPVTAYDDNGSSVLSSFNYAVTNGDPLFANYLGSGPVVCTRSAILPVNGTGTPCLTAGPQFTGLQSPTPTTPITTFGNQRSNQIWGPHYFDTDLTIMKNFHLPISETSNFGVGLQFFNILNHPSFTGIDTGLGDASFGQVTTASSPRLLQFSLELSF